MWSLSAHSGFPLFNISWVFGEKMSPGERGTLESPWMSSREGSRPSRLISSALQPPVLLCAGQQHPWAAVEMILDVGRARFSFFGLVDH